jgi:hypothetical protein
MGESSPASRVWRLGAATQADPCLFPRARSALFATTTLAFPPTPQMV